MANQTRTRPDPATRTNSECPFCGGDKMHSQYLCRRCWPQLPKTTQQALYKRDSQSVERYRLLLSWINAEHPLSEIHII